jgi:hypothetical protein
MRRLPTSDLPSRLLICMLPALLLSACLGRPQVSLQIPPAHCADQIPDSLKADTPGTAAPQVTITGVPIADWEAIARAWVPFGGMQTMQLGLANLDKRTIVEIYARCEAREAEIAKALQPKRRFFGLF